MASIEQELPVASPTDLQRTGHLLLPGQSDMLRKIRLALHQKKYRKGLSIGIFDFSSEHLLSQTFEEGEDENGPWSILYHVIDVEVAKKALEELDLAFEARKQDASLAGTWILLIDGLAADNWELFQEYLKDGQGARMYVIAATSDAYPTGSLRAAFDTVIEKADG